MLDKAPSVNSRRIDRPSYRDLNPFEDKLDELTYKKGNPFLRPQYTNGVELTHTFMGFFNTTLGYSHTNDVFTEYIDTAGNGASYLQQGNIAAQDNFTLSLSIPLPIAKWWEGYLSVTGILSSFDANFREGYSYSDEVDAYIEKFKSDPARIVVISSAGRAQMNAVSRLISKKADVLVEDINVAKQTIGKLNLGGRVVMADVATEPEPLYIACTPADPRGKTYADLFSAGIASPVSIAWLTCKSLVRRNRTSPGIMSPAASCTMSPRTLPVSVVGGRW